MSRIIDGRGIPERAKPVRNEKLRRKWAALHPFCECCRHDGNAWGHELETHHIIGGSGRSDEPCNLLRLCRQCHLLAEGAQVRMQAPAGQIAYWPKLTLGMCLWLKAFREPVEHDPGRLTVLRGQALPELEPVPDCLLNSRESPDSSRELQYFRSETQRLFDAFCTGFNQKLRRITLSRLMGPHRLRISEYSADECDELREKIARGGR